MAVTKQRKIEIAKKYIDILKIINILGNKVMYKTLLEEVCMRFKLIKNRNDYNSIIRELEQSELIRVERYTAGKVIILKKASIAILANKDSTESVAAVSSKIVQNRLKLTTLRTKYALFISSLDNLDTFLRVFNNILSINKNDFFGMAYALQSRLEVLRSKKEIDEKSLNEELNRLVYNHKVIKNNFKKDTSNRPIATTKYIKSIDYQISNNCYAIKAFSSDSKIKFKIAIFVITERLNEKKLAEIIANTFDFYRYLCKDASKCEFEFDLMSNTADIERALKKINKINKLNYIEDAILKTRILRRSDIKKLKINYLTL